MKIINKIFLVSFVLLLFSCGEKNTFEEPMPTSSVFTVEGHEFFVEGTIDGIPFRIDHISKNEKNTPINRVVTGSLKEFGTQFSLEAFGGTDEKLSITFGVTALDLDELLDVVEIGEYVSWYDFNTTSNSRGEVVVSQVLWEDEFYTNDLFAIADPFNQFKVDHIEQLEKDPNLDSIYDGKIYKVEGSFQVLLDDWNDSTEKIPLVINKYSALFYNEF